MKRMLILFGLLGMLAAVPGAAQEPEEEYPHYIGGTFGFSTGYGLTYRYWKGPFGFQIVTAPYWHDQIVMVNVGTAVFRTFYETRWTRLFVYLAGSYYFSRDENNEEDGATPAEPGYTSEHNFAVGGGPGFEIFLFRNVALDVLFGLGYRTDGGLSLTGEAGIYYRF